MVNGKVALVGLVILLLGIFFSGIHYMLGLDITIPVLSSIVLPEFITGIPTAYILIGIGVVIFAAGLKKY